MAVPVEAAETLFSLRRDFKNAVRSAHFMFWDHTTCQTDRAAAWKQLFRATKPAAKPALLDFGSNGSFADKCRALRAEFFPPTLDNLPDLPGNWCPPALVNLRTSFHPITSDEVSVVLSHVPPRSAPGLDSISYQVLREAHSACPLLFPTLFTALLQFSVTPAVWKAAKVVPVHKPGKTD